VADEDRSVAAGAPSGKGADRDAGVSAEGSAGSAVALAEEAFGDLPAFAGGGGVGSAGLSLPWERSAAARVMRRAPQPGQAMMLSGSKDWVIADLQRGQFMALDREREYNVW
jgi:hypothetical protein